MAADKETRQVEILLNAQQANASIKDMAAGVALMNNQLAKMSQDDPRREQLKKDFLELKARVAEARAEINGYTKSEEQLRQETEQLTQANAQTIATGQKLTASYREMKDAAGILEKQLEELSGDDPGRQQLIADYQELKTRMAETKQEFNEATKSAHELRLEEMQLAAANQQLVVSGQQAGASLNDMKAAAGILEKQLHAISADDPGRAQMIRDFQLLQQRIGQTKDEVATYVKTEEELRQETEKLNQRNLEVILNGKKLNASFQEMTDSAALLEKQLHELASDAPGRKQLIADYQSMQDRIEGMKKEMGQATQESNTFRDAMAFAGVTVGAEALIEGVKELGAEIINTTKEVADLRGNINTLTGATGKDLDGLTTSVLAISRTFGKDFNEVLQASNTLSKQMGVSQQEALRLVQQGFLAGADAGGDFLDQVKEYAPQFRDAGASASEFIGHISQASAQGIFSDKGADVVKEFGFRIREQTKATSEAMQAAFGSDFTKEIFAGINNKSLTVMQALQKVGQQMDETKIPASQLQTVIADVFGGPGEDAGIDYLKSLKNVGKGVDELVDKTNVYTQRQERLLASQTELAEAQNELTKEFEGGSTILDTLTNKSMTLLYTLLASLGATFKELFEPVQRIWASFAELAESLGWVSEGALTAKSAGELLGNVIHFILTPTRLLWGVIADVVKATVEWAKSSDNARGYLQLVALPVKVLYELLKNGPAYFTAFAAGAESAFGSIGRAWSRVKGGDFTGAKDEFATLGKNVGLAYRQAFDAAVAKKQEAAAVATTTGGKAPAAQGAQGGDGITDAAREKAAQDAQKAREKERKERKAAQDKIDQEHLNDLKRLVKEEGDALAARNTLKASIETKGQSDALVRAEEERQKLFDAATKKVDALTGLEADYTEQVVAIVAERDLRLRELADKNSKAAAEAAEKDRTERLDKEIAQSTADAEVEVAQAQLKLANKVLTEQEYQDAIFAVKQAAMQRELDLIKQRDGAESVAWKKLQADKLRDEATHIKKLKGENEELAAFKKKLTTIEKTLNDDSTKWLEEMLGEQTLLYKAFKLARKADAIATIGVKLWEEVQQYWETAAGMGPVAGPVYGIAMSGVATIRHGMAAAKIAGYEKGGATGSGTVVANPTSNLWDVMGMTTGLRVGSSGQLLDEAGRPVAGVVHEDEYVIPKWMRQDPQVMQVEGWLEQRRQRGYYEGGPTTEGNSSASGTDVVSAGATSAEAQRLVRVLESLDQRLQLVEEWPTSFEVVLDLLGLDRDLTKLKKVKDKSEIRPK